jgi:uncharacterized YccA/Bax inhibitor family protein
MANFKKNGNPFMKEEVFRNASKDVLDSGMIQSSAQRMTVSGAVNKTFILMGIMLLTSVVGYASPGLMWVGAIAGLVLVVVASFKQHLSMYLAPAYAAFEGLFVGAITAMYAAAYNGIIIQAVSLTIAILFMMLFIYKTGIIKVTQKFRMGVMMATGAVFIVYLASWILGMFGVSIPFLHEGGMMGIGISLVIIGIASFNLLLDFDNFEKGEKFGAPTYMEWFSAMGLLITLVWLYIEILRLLAILSSND